METKLHKDGTLDFPAMPKGLPSIEMSDNARKVFMKRYVRRKPDGNGDPEETGRVIRKLIKAGEENGENWETVCAGLHREWAVRLRTGRGIPPVPEAFFTAEGQPGPEDPAAGRPKERSGEKC